MGKITVAFILASKYTKNHKNASSVTSIQTKSISKSTINFDHLIKTPHRTFLSSTPLSELIDRLYIDKSDSTNTNGNISKAFEAAVIKDYEPNNDYRADHIRRYRNDLTALSMIKLGQLTLGRFLNMSCGDSNRTTLEKVVLVWNWAAVEEEKARKEWWSE